MVRLGRVLLLSIVLLLTSSASQEATPSEPTESLPHPQRTQRPRLGSLAQPHGLPDAVAGSYLALNTLIQEFPPALYQSLLAGNASGFSAQGPLLGNLRRRMHRSEQQLGASDVVQRGSVRRQLQLDVTLPPASVPVLVINTTNGTYIILAPNRTRRPNPIKNFQYYDGGWDFFSADYWASLAWTTVYGAALGFVWLIFGVGIVAWSAITCMCCRGKWSHLRDRSLRYERSELTLPLLFMLFGVALELVGFGLMVSGAVKFTNTAHSLTNFTVNQVDQVSSVVLNITPFLRRLASPNSSLSFAINAELRSQLVQVTDKVENIATTAQQKSVQAGNSVDNVLDTLQDILFCVGIITVGFVLIGLVFTLCRLVIFSNIVTTIVWFLCFFTWVLVTVFLFVWLFGGDTNVSMGQIAAVPTDLSKFNVMVPCMDPNALDSLALFSRFVASEVIIIVNATIMEEAQIVFQVLGTPAGICNPFGPAPNYTLDRSTCDGICNGQSCTGSLVDMDTLTQRTPQLLCNSSSTVGCLPNNTVGAIVGQVVGGADQIVKGITVLLPLLERILRCAYISYLAQSLQWYVGDLEYATLLLWMGFMFASVGAIFFGACAPVYVYRAVRCYGSHDGENERDPIKGQESGEYRQGDSAQNNQEEANHGGAEPSYENGAHWAARPAPNPAGEYHGQTY